MASTLKFKYGTEAQILALPITSSSWVNRAFYYPSDKTYFYQALNGVMKKYGAGEDAGIGCTLNEKIIGGVKPYIEETDILFIPENFDYNTMSLKIDGNVIIEGQLNIIN